ncbi:hypothetical protein SDRG_06123 [Saprolegnia diclina VS20]|uniref:HSF-type DNA-binding domain-containing protein n=1 Tax=Saprolegnia diclina (strain VS20) TaxID=1156394 RepID=T0RW24_SAPDV|nr:hypothetical protein SDRG_06123 [Saprolegnia diclina VS20]EQC36688.1 hypothetical protein SDRG_06123 [Saprolegnia diclina VS20]|eukprot:XP_008610109.1 hypothetical protein SDRG_06123 [Saprolegnia diclina VS20]
MDRSMPPLPPAEPRRGVLQTAAPRKSIDSIEVSATGSWSKHPQLYMQRVYCALESSRKCVATWTCNGTAFAVLDIPAFEEEILTVYFKGIRFHSFARILNGYGFKRAKRKDGTAYDFQHPQFRRGNWKNLPRLAPKRKPVEEVMEKRVEDLTILCGELQKNLKEMRNEIGRLLQEEEEEEQHEERQRRAAQTERSHHRDDDDDEEEEEEDDDDDGASVASSS